MAPVGAWAEVRGNKRKCCEGEARKKTLQSSFPLRTPVPFTAKEEGRGEKSKDILFQGTRKEIHFFVKVFDRVFRSTNPHISFAPLLSMRYCPAVKRITERVFIGPPRPVLFPKNGT